MCRGGGGNLGFPQGFWADWWSKNLVNKLFCGCAEAKATGQLSSQVAKLKKSRHCKAQDNNISCAERTEKNLFPYSPINLFTSKKVAFTLAEVLITLGIIGVVAALTLPSVIQKYNEQATVTKVKKFYSAFSQAYLMAINEHGTIDNWGLSNASTYVIDEETNAHWHTQESIDNIDKFFEIMSPYLKIISNSKYNVKSINDSQGYVMADGIAITNVYLKPVAGCNTYCGDFYIKTQGKENDEKKSKYIFNFRLQYYKITPTGYTDEQFAQCLNHSNYAKCTAWVITNGNMDYLHCSDLSWNGKTKCK